MSRLSATGVVAVLAALCWWADPSFAQVGYNRPASSGLSRPTTSPYLNLLRGGDRGLNYYNLVRPEFEFRNAYQGLQGQVNQQQQLLRQSSEEGLPVTGHAIRFQNYSHYYPTPGGGSAASITQRATGTTPPRQSHGSSSGR